MTTPNSSRRNERLNQLAHDANASLHVINMASTLLKSSSVDQEKFASICATLETESRKAAQLVQELLAAAKADD
ncbi:hypothetical protein [Thalassoroseus pseudoceratinae]|uniref:hypothetical protein n=1 Tax=Thalassoroseus pseudoceratinae TaxID=2713176 RepID=UPI001420FC66|nr:hypothetical protein [Thalassoroseus pseudoceratinae]